MGRGGGEGGGYVRKIRFGGTGKRKKKTKIGVLNCVRKIEVLNCDVRMYVGGGGSW